MGLWLVQQCRATWTQAGQADSYAEPTQPTAGAPIFQDWVLVLA